MGKIRQVENLIDGNWVPARSAETLVRENPANKDETVAICPASGPADANAAVDAARRASSSWAATPIEERIAVLQSALRLIEARAETIAAADVRESGKTLAECRGEVGRAPGAVGYQLSVAKETLHQVRTLESGYVGAVSADESRTLTVELDRIPLGVVVVITPWNYPVSRLLAKLVPALVAGNAVVAKPSELTPVTAAMLGEAFTEAGLPPGVLNIVFGEGHAVGQALVDHEDVDGISFTGSSGVGSAIAATSVTREVKVQCEMGGKNALVVMQDADVEAAVDAAVLGSFTAAGQWCVSTGRIFVQEGVYETFRDRFVARAAKLRVGDGFGDGVEMGPLSSRAQFAKVMSYLEEPRLSGTVLCGGRVPDDPATHKGYFVAPTVVEEPDRDSAIATEEVFGPVVTLSRISDVDEAIAVTNATQYGLCSAIWTEDDDIATRYAQGCVVGRVGVNLPTAFGDNSVSSSGRKSSGFGEPEGATEGLMFYSRLKPVFRHR